MNFIILEEGFVVNYKFIVFIWIWEEIVVMLIL